VPENQMLTASAFWLCLATHYGRVAEWHLPHAVMSAGGHLRLPRLPTEEGLLNATPQTSFLQPRHLKLLLSQNFVNVSHAQAPLRNGVGIA